MSDLEDYLPLFMLLTIVLPGAGEGVCGGPHLSGRQQSRSTLHWYERMLGTFNQHMPMILSNNYWHQSKPTSLHDTAMGVVP